jgi:hypothetical protein
MVMRPQDDDTMPMHRCAVGQHVSSTRDHPSDDIWRGGLEIVSLLTAGHREPQYQIRSAEQTYDQVVGESQLQKDLGAREQCGWQQIQ